MPKLTVAGHPAHPQLVTIPIALFPFSLALDALHLATGEERYAEGAHLAMVGATAGAAVAAVAGAMDFAEIPAEHETKSIARLHGGMNLGLVGLSVVNVWLRRRREPPSGRLPALLSTVGTVAMLVSSWYGAHLVYEHGVRVKGRGPLRGAPEAAPPGDRRAVEALEEPLGRRERRR
jgi:uncharacterized membrane protein